MRLILRLFITVLFYFVFIFILFGTIVVGTYK